MSTLPPAILAEIAAHAGTPCYIYDRARIEANYARIAAAFSASHQRATTGIYYAVKANANAEILKLLNGLGAGFDVVSVGEMMAAVRAGADASRIVFAGVGKRDDELIAALDARIGWINVESEQELRVLSDLASACGQVARVALRINPSVDPHTHRYLATGKHGSKFGVDADTALDIVARRADCPGLRIEGLHVHIGSMVSDAEPYAEALGVMLDLVAKCRAMGANIVALDMGGGFGIAYQPDQHAAPIEDMAAEMLPLIHAANLELHLEPGRSIVADAGVLLTRVLYTKTNGDTNYVVVDAAMNDLIRPALYGAAHRVSVVGESPLSSRPSALVDVVGPVCESGDFLAQAVTLPQPQRGDLLVVHEAGAYGMSMASNYNLRPRAAEVIVEGEAWRMIRRRESLEDIL